MDFGAYMCRLVRADLAQEELTKAIEKRAARKPELKQMSELSVIHALWPKFPKLLAQYPDVQAYLKA
jgi:hypothetical protein